MRFLIFRTSDAPREWADDAADVEWPDEPPVPHAERAKYEHRDEGSTPFMADGWTVHIDSPEGFLRLLDFPKGPYHSSREIIVREFAGHPAIELYDTYRE